MIHSSFIFEENHVIEEEDEVVIVQEGLDIIDIDDIRNLVDLIKVLSIDEESGNLKVIVDGGELTRNINRKKKSDVLQAYECSLCDKCYKRD